MPLPCVSHSPAFHPRFESLADEDLDICEIIALGLILGAPFDPRQPLNEALLDGVVQLTDCFTQMSKRAKREYEIWWVLYLAQGCVTDAQMRRFINSIKVKTTLDQRAAILTGLRTTVWDYANCGDLP